MICAVYRLRNSQWLLMISDWYALAERHNSSLRPRYCENMKTLDVLMVILLVIFVGSLVGLIIYGEVWRINLSMTDTQIESFDAVQTRNAFILAAVSMVSGGSMLYILVTRFSQEEEKKETSASGNADE